MVLNTYPRGIPRPPLPALGITLSLCGSCCTASWTQNGHTSSYELNCISLLFLGTPLQEHVNSHVHECTHHLYQSLLLVEKLFQESTLQMALREQNRRQNPNCQGEHPIAQVIAAIPSTPTSPGGSDMLDDDETLSWPIFVKYQGFSKILLVCDGMSITSLKNAICDRLNIPPHA